MNRNDLKSSPGTWSKQTDLFSSAGNSSNDAVLLIDFGSSENNSEGLNIGSKKVQENFEADFDGFFNNSSNTTINITNENNSEPREDLNMGSKEVQEEKEDENFEVDFDGGFKKSPNIAINITDESSYESSDKDLITKPLGGLFSVDFEVIPDVNVYQHKKTVAQGMMDLALFSANANQLRYIYENPNHFYYYPGVTLILISLIVQVLVGVGLILNTRYNVKNEREICLANKINNFTIIGIFLITIINVFISAFGVAANSTNDTANLNLNVVPKVVNNTQQ